MIFHNRHRGASANGLARTDIPHDAGLCRDLRAIPNFKMAGNPGLPCGDHKITKLRRSRNPDLGNDNTSHAKFDVMADLHKVVDTAAIADHRIRPGPPVECRIGPDFDNVTNVAPAKPASAAL